MSKKKENWEVLRDRMYRRVGWYEDPIFVLPVLIVVIVFFVLHSCGG